MDYGHEVFGHSPAAKSRSWELGVCTDLINADCVGYTSSPATRELPLKGKPVFIQPRIETVGADIIRPFYLPLTREVDFAAGERRRERGISATTG